MLNNKRQNSWVLLIGLLGLLALGACRPIAVSGGQPQTPAPPPPPTVAKAPVPTTAGEGQSADLQQRIAQLPTPPPNAMVPTPAAFQPEEMAVQGSADAPVTIIEFSDYQCPFCQRYFDDAYPQIIQNYVASGQVRYIFKDLPLEELHPQAAQAAEAARCAGEQDAYWEMHDQLFAAQERWAGQSEPVPIFVELGGGLGLDKDALQSCLESGRHQQAVLSNLAEGQSLGATGTPTFFINGYPLVGARPYEQFELGIALAAAGRLADAYAQVPTPTPRPADQILTGDSAVQGSADAPVLMIEYSDYQCPYCGRYTVETFSRLKKEYIDTGIVRYVFKDFPLGFHAQAQIAAHAARCAGDQGGYWGMHDLLFANPGAWSNAAAADVFRGYAGELDLDEGTFAACLESGMHNQAIDDDLQEGLSVGVSGTPAFFVGGRFISGAQPYQVFQQAIEAALGEQ